MLTEVRENLKQAMRDREMLKTSLYRSLIANVEVNEKQGKTIDEVEFQRIVKKMISQHEESIEAFENGGREDLIIEERAKIKLLEQYLPEMLTHAQITDIVVDTCVKLDYAGEFNIGNVMKQLREEYATVMDMKLASEIVKNYKS